MSSACWWTAALLLWWIAVRRWQSSLWAVAAQLTAGLTLGELVAAALGMVRASIETRGELATLIGRQLPTAFASRIGLCDN